MDGVHCELGAPLSEYVGFVDLLLSLKFLLTCKSCKSSEPLMDGVYSELGASSSEYAGLWLIGGRALWSLKSSLSDLNVTAEV